MISTDGASKTSLSRRILFFAEIVDLLPILHPFSSTIFGSSLTESLTTFNQTSGPRYTSSPNDMCCAFVRPRSHEGEMDKPLPILAKGYVARNHSVFSFLATREKKRMGSRRG